METIEKKLPDTEHFRSPKRRGPSGRNGVVFGAVLIQLCLGTVYAWSVFTPALVEAGWSKAQTQGVFAAGLAAFAIAMVYAGRLMPKIGPRKLALLGGAILGAGYVLGGAIAPTSFPVLLVCLGLISGTGIGLAYVVPIAVGVRWFPERKGWITGISVAGFGFGAMLWVKLAGSWGNLIENIGLGGTFSLYGAIFFATCLIGSQWMVFPPEDAAASSASAGGARPEIAMTSSEMLRTPQFAMLFLCFVVAAGAGLMTIGLMKLFPLEALQSSGLSALEASAIAGTAMGVFFSLANGLGRIAWGMLGDRFGIRKTLVLMLAAQGCVVLAFQSMAAGSWSLYLGSTLIGFTYGGSFALFPAATADTFGARHLAQNYGWVFLAYGIGGIAGPMLGGRLGDMGNFPMAFTICGVLCWVAACLAAMIDAPKAQPHRI